MWYGILFDVMFEISNYRKCFKTVNSKDCMILFFEGRNFLYSHLFGWTDYHMIKLWQILVFVKIGFAWDLFVLSHFKFESRLRAQIQFWKNEN